MIVTLTANPALDLSTAVDEVVPFTKLRCGAMRRDPGGGGINVARIIARLGGETKALFPIGGCVGQHLLKLLDAEGVPRRAIPIAEETREDFTFFERSTGKQFRFVEQGPKLSEGEWKALIAAFADEMQNSSYAVVSGSLPPGVPDAFFGEAAEAAKTRRVKLALDTTGAGLKAALGAGIALVKPNQREFAELVGAASSNVEELAARARALVADGRIEAVALSLAEEGAILATKKEVWRARAPQVKAVSTVGAGDSFLGALVYHRAEGADWKEAFGYAVAAGTAALLSPGTDLARPDAIARLAREVEVKEMG